MRTGRILAGTLIAAVVAAPSAASAESWPSRPVEWIVPFAPGGSTDTVARILADKLGTILKQPVYVVNRPGAESEIGYKAAARASPDGYTMVLTVPSVVTNPLYFKNSLDPSELAPVIYLAQGPYILLGSAKTAPKTVPDLIAAMKAHPGKTSCAMTGGVGSIGCEMLQAMTKSALLKVPYRGSNPGTLAVMSAQVDLVFNFSIAARSATQSNQIRALATTAPKRGSNPMPELPAMAEFIPGFELDGWDGVMVPRGTPPDTVGRLNKAMNVALNMPDVRAELEKGGLDTVGGAPDEFALRLRAVQQAFRRVLDAAGVKPQ